MFLIIYKVLIAFVVSAMLTFTMTYLLKYNTHKKNKMSKKYSSRYDFRDIQVKYSSQENKYIGKNQNKK